MLSSVNSFAQFDPRVNCTNGCTSNDIQIKTAYLVDPETKNPLATNFQCQGTASVKLALELTTKTPRVGVYIYARIVNKNTLEEIEIVSECFSTSLESVAPLTTKVVFNELIGWPCGTPIILKDVFIGWGTGNKDFCEGSSLERCPGTPSKCYSLPPGEYITVVVPTAASTTSEKCSTTPGGTTAIFNLESLNNDVIGSQQNVSVTWYSNIGLTNVIGTPTAFVSGYAEVYAKVSNNSDPSVYSSSTVILNVIVTPVANAASSTLCSATAGGTTASFNLTALETTIINGQQNVAVAWYNDAGLTTAISSPHNTGTTTVYAKVTNNNATTCFSSVGVLLTVNPTPTVTSTSATLCSTTGGGSTASFDLNALATTIINGQSNVALSWFSDVALQNAISSPHVTGTTTVYAKVTNTNATSCTNSIAISLTVNSRPGTIAADVTPPTCAVPTGTITVTSSKTGLTFSLNSTNPADFTNATGIFASLSPGNYTIRSKSAAGCISDGVTKEVTAAAGGTPAADVVIITHPGCSSSTGSLKVVKAGSLLEYDNTIFEFSNGGDFTSNPVFSFKAGEGYSITVRRISDHTCFAITSCEGETPIAEKEGAANTSALVEGTMTTPLHIGIKAIPNPFTDRVRFAVTSETAGNGTLDVFNMQGQKIKTVYSGYVPAGTSYYDLEINGQSSGQLVYILRIGAEKLSGKLIRVIK